MAEAALEPTPESDNFIRLSRVLIKVGTKIVCGLFDSIHKPSILPRILKKKRALLNHLKSDKIITHKEMVKLFPSIATYGESKDFDITLLLKLLRNICKLTAPPVTGWDKLPNESNLSLEADLAIIKFHRNETYAHTNEMELTEHEFNDLWTQIEGALLRIVHHYSPGSPGSVDEWRKEIEKRRTAPISSEDITAVLNELPEMKIKVIGDFLHTNIASLNQDERQQLMADFEAAIQKVLLNKDIIVQDINSGSINIQLRVKTVEALKDLWERYKNGDLRSALERVIIETQKFGKHMEIEVTMSDEQYQDALIFFDELTQHKEKEIEGVTERLDKLSLDIVHGKPIKDQGNKFQAHLVEFTSKDQIEKVLHHIKQDPRYSEATNTVLAYRYYDGDKETFIDDSDDGRYYLAGRKLRYLLRHVDATNVIVIVTCWQGDVYLYFDVFKHIYKCALELLLSRNLVGEKISKQDIPKLLEKIEHKFEKQKQRTGGYKPEEQEPTDFIIIHSKEIVDRKSKFQAHLAHVTSKDQVEQVLEQLKEDNKIAKAKYNMYAYRIYVKDKKSYLEEGRDDGENRAGKRLSELLQVSKVEDVVVIVTRWHGEIPLGPDRFKHINACAQEVIKMGLDQGLIISSQSSSSGAEQVQTKQKKGKGKHK